MRYIVLRALEFVRHLRIRIIVTQFLMVLASLLGLAMPLILGMIFDAKHELSFLLGLLIVTGTVATVVNYFKSLMIGSVGNDIALTLRNNLYEKLQKLPQSFYAKKNTGDILSTVINDINLFKDALSTGVLYIGEMLLSFIVVMIIMLVIDPVLTWILLIVLPLTLFVSRLVSKPVDGVSKVTQMQLSEITNVLN
ncbi:MAG: ABC transporter ATP-binding protein, partial [Firmicutes bacterium]|nr:ABC transporter ATP-binding protein [Bacillota bacterium]